MDEDKDKVLRERNNAVHIKNEQDKLLPKLLRKTPAQLEDMLKDKTRPIHVLMLISSILEANKKGKYGDFDKMMREVEKDAAASKPQPDSWQNKRKLEE